MNIGEWNERFAREIVEQLIEQGVELFCISPGNRSTPLAYAIASNPRARRVVHFDERGLGFIALGAAKASQKPVALLVTSGTAVGNLYPAVMEASLDHVPLILLTSDRPPELRDTKANQTCDQIKFFGSYVRMQFDMPSPNPALPFRMIATTVAQSVFSARTGPVQLNCPFPEPFFSKEPFVQETSAPVFHGTSKLAADEQSLLHFAKFLNRHQNGVIVAGNHSPKNAAKLAEHLGWPLFADITSEARGDSLAYFDAILKALPEVKADLILHIGDEYVSKALLEWPCGILLHVSNHPERCDPEHRVAMRLTCDPSLFCDAIIPHLEKREGWVSEWKLWSAQVEKVIESFPMEGSEIATIRALDDSTLFIANSMPIRDANNFFFPKKRRAKIFANRGLSGIDGNIATCAGIAQVEPVTAILGDLATLHDLNSLALLKKSSHPVTLIVINNGGGGIFSFFTFSSFDAKLTEEISSTAHSYTFKQAAALFDLPYYTTLEKRDHSCLIEITTDRAENVALHKALDKTIKECLACCTVS